MNICIICDRDFNVKQLAHYGAPEANSITFFALSSNFILLEKIKKELQSYGKIIEVNSAVLINAETNAYRDELMEWSHRMGELKVGKKNLKQWFMTPDSGVSTWWLGQLSEKNNIQVDLFLKMIQTKAIKKFLSTIACECYFIAIDDSILRKAVVTVLKQNKQKIKIVRTNTTYIKDFKALAKVVFSKLGIFGDVISGVARLFHFFKQWMSARRILGSLTARLPKKNPLLFVSYFPAIDKIAAEQGIFRNKYALPLHDMLKEAKLSITWLMMPVPYDGYDYAGALQLAKMFAQHGEKMFILQEFFTPGILVKTLLWWLRQSILSMVIYPVFKKQVLNNNFLGKEQLSIMKSLWRLSFSGSAGQHGIIYYLAFKKIFHMFQRLEKSLYYLEMQNWEKALNAAKQKCQPNTVTLGFQHAALSPNYFSYFYSYKDFSDRNSELMMPLPNNILVNGAYADSLLASCGYPNLRRVESIRYLYFNTLPPVSDKMLKLNSKPLLVCGSMNEIENISILSLAHEVVQRLPGYQIWLKAHPSLSFQSALTTLNITLESERYKIVSGDIQTILPLVDQVLISEGTISLEAIRFGCVIIIPIFSDKMLTNPLVGFNASYYLVSGINELVQVLLRYDCPTYPSHLIHQYFDLDSRLMQWKALLTK